MKVSKFRTIQSILAITLFVGAGQWFLTQTLSAQDATEATEETVEAAPPKKTLIDQYKTGGWAMYPLTFFSIAGFGLIVYNFMAIRPDMLLQPAATLEIDKALEELDISKAKELCDRTRPRRPA